MLGVEAFNTLFSFLLSPLVLMSLPWAKRAECMDDFDELEHISSSPMSRMFVSHSNCYRIYPSSASASTGSL